MWTGLKEYQSERGDALDQHSRTVDLVERSGVRAGADDPLVESFGIIEEGGLQLVVVRFVHLPVMGAVIFNLHLLVIEADAAVGGRVAREVAAMDII